MNRQLTKATFLVVISLGLAISTPSCHWIRAGGVALTVISVLKDVGQELLSSTLAQAAKELIDKGWDMLFDSAADSSSSKSDVYKDIVEEVTDTPLKGMSKYDLSISASAAQNDYTAQGEYTIEKQRLNFERIRKETPWMPTPETIRTIDTHTRTLSAQVCLAVLGYEPGDIDGIPGKITTRALKKFQRDSGIQVNGELDDLTYKTLMQSVKISTNKTF